MRIRGRLELGGRIENGKRGWEEEGLLYYDLEVKC